MRQLWVVALMVIGWLGLAGCATTQPTLYQQLGGQTKVEEIVENFIQEIGFDPIMFGYFEESNIDRFREKMTEHLCMLTGGGCEYTGDSMVDVHSGMNIPEADFNHGVDVLIKAMNDAGIPHTLQNQVLARMAPLRSEMIYQ